MGFFKSLKVGVFVFIKKGDLPTHQNAETFDLNFFFSLKENKQKQLLQYTRYLTTVFNFMGVVGETISRGEKNKVTNCF